MTTPAERPTPRTDAVAERPVGTPMQKIGLLADLARTLERELAAAREPVEDKEVAEFIDRFRNYSDAQYYLRPDERKRVAALLESLSARLTAPVPELDEIKARLIAKFPQVEGKTPPLYYMEIAEEYGQVARDLGRRLGKAQLNLRAADAMAEAVDTMIQRKALDSRSLVADARLDYGDPFKYEANEAAESKLASAVAAERERCAKISDETSYDLGGDCCVDTAHQIAAAIRGSEREGGGT